MRDQTGREIDYMRISITDRCNLRCKYCMPDGIQCMPRWEILSLEELEAIAVCAADLGIRKCYVTRFVQLRIAKVKRNLVCSLNSTCFEVIKDASHLKERTPAFPL